MSSMEGFLLVSCVGSGECLIREGKLFNLFNVHGSPIGYFHHVQSEHNRRVDEMLVPA